MEFYLYGRPACSAKNPIPSTGPKSLVLAGQDFAAPTGGSWLCGADGPHVPCTSTLYIVLPVPVQTTRHHFTSWNCLLRSGLLPNPLP